VLRQAANRGQEAQVDWFEAVAKLGGERYKLQFFAMRSMASVVVVNYTALRRLADELTQYWLQRAHGRLHRFPPSGCRQR
jgi:hypothetical protein